MDVFNKVRRENLNAYKVGRIGQGTQGDIFKISVEGRVAAVKDIADKNLLYRLLLGRWLLSREFKIYHTLRDLPGIPSLYEKIDKDGFIFEFIEGAPLSSFPRNAPIPTSFFNALEKLVHGMHRSGVVHSDLKHKKNILVSTEYQPFLVDFGASWSASSSWNLPKRWLYHQFLQIDLNAVAKIRHRFVHGHPNNRDRENLARRNFMEKCSRLYQWCYRLISRKHKMRRRRKPFTGGSSQGTGCRKRIKR